MTIIIIVLRVLFLLYTPLLLRYLIFSHTLCSSSRSIGADKMLYGVKELTLDFRALLSLGAVREIKSVGGSFSFYSLPTLSALA